MKATPKDEPSQGPSNGPGGGAPWKQFCLGAQHQPKVTKEAPKDGQWSPRKGAPQKLPINDNFFLCPSSPPFQIDGHPHMANESTGQIG